MDALRQQIEQLKLKMEESNTNNEKDSTRLDLNRSNEEVSTGLDLNRSNEEVSTGLDLNNPTPMDI